MNRCLGKKPARFDKRTLKLSKYLKALPPVDPTCTWSVGVKKWPMFGNDRYGDCVVASAAHMIQLWTAQAGTELIVPEQEVIDLYLHLSPNDEGLEMLSFLNYWKKTGIFGHKIGGYVSIDPQMIDHQKLAIGLFGGVDTGFQIPQSAIDQNSAGGLWKVVPDDGGIVGGHSIPYVDYSTGGEVCITWGAKQQADIDFWQKYCDESYAIFSQDWMDGDQTPDCLDKVTLLDDLNALG